MAQRLRRALHPVSEFDTPAPAVGPLLGEDPRRSEKRARTYATPGTDGQAAYYDTPMLLSERPSSSRGVFDYLQERGGKIKELEDEVSRSRVRQDQLIQEVQLKQEQVTVLQQDLASAKAAATSRAQFSGRSELAEVERLLEEELSKGLDLESQLRATQDRMHAAEARASETAAATKQARADLERQLHGLQLQVQTAQRQATIVQAECDGRVRKAEAEAGMEKRRNESEQKIHRVVLQQLEEARSSLAKRSVQTSPRTVVSPASSTATATLLLRVKALEEEVRVRDKELLALRTLSQGQLPHQPRTLDTVPGPQAAGGLLGVSQAGLSGSIARPGGAEESVLQARLREWERGPLQQQLASAAAALPAGEVPAAVSQALQDGYWSAPAAAAAFIGLAKRLAEMREQLTGRDAKLLELSAISGGHERQCTLLSAQLQVSAAELQRAVFAEKGGARQLAAVVQERDALRRALAVAPASSTSAPGCKPDSVSGRIEAAQLAAQTAELQVLVADLQLRLEALQGEVANSASSEAAQRMAAAALKTRAEAAEARCVQLEKEADGLALDVARMHEKLGRGEVSQASVRVLHFKMNPEALHHSEAANSAVLELKAENAALASRLRELAEEVQRARKAASLSAAVVSESGDGQCQPGRTSREAGGDLDVEGDASASKIEEGMLHDGTSPGATSPLCSIHAVSVRDAQIAVLEHRLREMDKSMVRLKEVFKERISAFREACYSLFGYRVDMTSQATAVKDAASATTMFSLKPQHSDGSDMLLVFKYTQARGMELVNNAYSERFGREVETFITKFRCIPAFTANLTMENFQKQTQC